MIQKIDAAEAAQFAGLREIARRESDARAKTLEKKRAVLRVAREASIRSARPPRAAECDEK